VDALAASDPLTVPTWLTAIFTGILAVGAIVTAVFAILAFRRQADELITLQNQARDSSAQLDLQRAQMAEQRAVNVAQVEVLTLQGQELAQSLAERKAAAEDARSAQAAKVTAWFGYRDRKVDPSGAGAVIRNASDLPVLDVRVFFHWVNERSDGSWTSANRGGPVERVRVIAPEHQFFVEMPQEIRDMTTEVNDQVYVVSIEFTDAAGQRWVRDPHGGLEPA
jgi:uncharacterized membrane-anchored protein YhcB (DUF1043 family)